MEIILEGEQRTQFDRLIREHKHAIEARVNAFRDLEAAKLREAIACDELTEFVHELARPGRVARTDAKAKP